MAEKWLLTREDLAKENFNNAKIDTEDIDKYLLYFAAILQLGLSEGLISEVGRNFIANTITKAIEISSEGDDEYPTNYILIRNYMYIVSSYLESKTNWDAWLELLSVRTLDDAFILIKNAKDWLEKRVSSAKKCLKDIKESVSKLNLGNVSNGYNILVFTLKNIMSSTSDFTKFDMTCYHGTITTTGTYILMSAKESQNIINFVENICYTVECFCMEVSILCKVNASKIFRDKKIEADKYRNTSLNKVVNLNKQYEDRLFKLKEEYLKQLENKDNDEVEVERRYLSEKYSIEEEQEREIHKLEDYLREEEILHVEIISGEYSLNDFIKEFAIYQMALDEKISYPRTLEERSQMIIDLTIKQAILEFISGNKDLLESSQIEFLKNCIE